MVCMQSFKILKFYDSPSHHVIEEISKLFSTTPYYIQSSSNIFLIKFEVEELLNNEKEIKYQSNKFSFLIMTNYKFEALIKFQAKYNIQEIIDATFQFQENGNEVSEELTDDWYQLLIDQQFTKLNFKLKEYKCIIQDIKFLINDDNVTIDQYGDFYINDVGNCYIPKLAQFLLEGSNNE